MNNKVGIKNIEKVLNKAEEVESEIVVIEEETYEGSPYTMATYSNKGKESDNAQERIDVKIDICGLGEKQNDECRGTFSEY